MSIDISGIERAAVVAALYNGAKCGGGFARMHYVPGDMSIQEAQQVVASYEGDHPDGLSFDYLKGRPLKFEISGNTLRREDLYDRDNGGPGTAERIIDALRK